MVERFGSRGPGGEETQADDLKISVRAKGSFSKVRRNRLPPDLRTFAPRGKICFDESRVSGEVEEKWFNDLGTFHAAVKKELLLKLYYNDT